MAELERRMSAAEFAEWAAFYAAEAKEQERRQKKAQHKVGGTRRRPRKR